MTTATNAKRSLNKLDSRASVPLVPSCFSRSNDYMQPHYMPEPMYTTHVPYPSYNFNRNPNMNLNGNIMESGVHGLNPTLRSKQPNNWFQPHSSSQSNEFNNNMDFYLSNLSNSHSADNFVYNQYKRRSDSQNSKYNNNWPIQEPELRGFPQQPTLANPPKKPLPDSVIQTITQRVQHLGLGERRRYFFSL